MKLKVCAAIVFSLFMSNSYISAAETTPDVDTSSFSCAEGLLPSIDILGRGTDFPSFLVEDVSAELKRQDPKAALLSIKCTGEPEITGVFVDVEQKGTTQSALDQLTVAFPVEMLVFTGEVNWMMHVKQGYQVTGLTSTVPKVTQKFEVLKTLDEDGSELEGKTIQVQRINQ